MKIKISSLGCRLNQSEIQSIATKLQANGHEIVRDNSADVIIINSCVVTVHSERKTRKLIYQAVRALEPKKSASIIVTGCFSQSIIKENNIYYIPNDYKHLIADIIEDPYFFSQIDESLASRFDYDAPTKATTTRVNLKIQDGCDNFCSYCIIPTVRGVPQSKPFKQVMDEFKSLIENGYKEVVLSGVMIGQYNSENCNLSLLLEELLKVHGKYRIHLSSLGPQYVDEVLIKLLADEKMVKHLHLSLQSGSDSILKSMNRHYTAKKYLNTIDLIRKEIPLFNFTTDIIVGFPGETEKDFQDTLNIIKNADLSHVHTFRYSKRPGTRAAEMNDVVEEKVKKERSQMVIDLYAKQKINYYKKFEGRNSIFLSERRKVKGTSGFNEYYIPVIVKDKVTRNEFYNIKTVFDEENVLLIGELD